MNDYYQSLGRRVEVGGWRQSASAIDSILHFVHYLRFRVVGDQDYRPPARSAAATSLFVYPVMNSNNNNASFVRDVFLTFLDRTGRRIVIKWYLPHTVAGCHLRFINGGSAKRSGCHSGHSTDRVAAHHVCGQPTGVVVHPGVQGSLEECTLCVRNTERNRSRTDARGVHDE